MTTSTILFKKIQQIAKQEHTTPFVVMLTGFKALLCRYLDRLQVGIGTVVANRNASSFNGTIGFFTETIVLLSHYKKNQNFTQLLKVEKKSVLNAYQHYNFSYPDCVELYRQIHAVNEEPIDILFVMNYPYEAPIFNEEIAEVIEPLSSGNNFPLIVIIREKNNSNYELKVDYSSRYTDNFINFFVENYQFYLEKLIDNKDALFVETSFLSPKQLHKIFQPVLSQFHAPDFSILGKLSKTCQLYPNKIAISYQDKTCTYYELDRISNQLANYLLSLDLKWTPESIVALYTDSSIEYIQLIIAILKLGGAFLPISKNIPVDRVLEIIGDSRALLLLSDDSSIHKCQIRALTITKVFKTYLHYSDKLVLQKEMETNQLVYVIYTSGSTGKPKGVLLENAGVINFVDSIFSKMNLSTNDNLLQFSSIGFDASIWEIFVALLNGLTLFIPDQAEKLLGKALENYILQHQITTAILPPTLLSHLDSVKLDCLKKLAVGGDKLDLSLAKLWSRNRDLYNAYGPTEATVCVSIAKVNHIVEKITIGKPISNMQIILMDKYLHPVPIGMIGEICILGTGLARGYLNNHPNNDHFVIRLLHGENIRFYRTGDLGLWQSNGELTYYGRIDRQVKIRGLRIELNEIENTLTQLHGITQALAIIDTENNIQVFYTGEDLELSVDTYLRNKLPRYMVPNNSHYINEFPKTEHGKVDIEFLKKISLDFNASAKSCSEKKLSLMEEKLLEIWQGYLNRKQFSVNDNFFHLGGNSLKAMEILANINQCFSLSLDIDIFFNYGTIAELAYFLENNIDVKTKTLITET